MVLLVLRIIAVVSLFIELYFIFVAFVSFALWLIIRIAIILEPSKAAFNDTLHVSLVVWSHAHDSPNKFTSVFTSNRSCSDQFKDASNLCLIGLSCNVGYADIKIRCLLEVFVVECLQISHQFAKIRRLQGPISFQVPRDCVGVEVIGCYFRHGFEQSNSITQFGQVRGWRSSQCWEASKKLYHCAVSCIITATHDFSLYPSTLPTGWLDAISTFSPSRSAD
mmetsp:Transcript_5479/g.8451  ORF Transcript_5479/g.8451 Transcript_5479/m.8451 type:complete len:222 (-) Transcript_5479:129-794(-)